jgi:cytochrome c556
MTRGRLLFAGLALLALSVGAVGVALAADDVPTVKAIMNKAHKKDTGILSAVGAELKKESPDFDAIKKQTDELTSLGAALGKGMPKKGDAASWAKLTTQYNANVQALAEAVAKKDVEAARKAQQTIAVSCGTCHKAHK